MTAHAAFDALPGEVANDAVRAVEDAIDAHIDRARDGHWYLDGEQGPAVVRALLDLGWRPPSPDLVLRA